MKNSACRAARSRAAERSCGLARVEAAVAAQAVPAARLADFTRSMRTTLWWQIAVFALALLLSARLPKARLDQAGPLAGA